MVGDAGEADGKRHGEAVLALLVRLALVPFDRGNIVGALPDDLPGDFRPAAHGVDAHNAAVKSPRLQQFGSSCDLGGFLRRRYSPQHQPDEAAHARTICRRGAPLRRSPKARAVLRSTTTTSLPVAFTTAHGEFTKHSWNAFGGRQEIASAFQSCDEFST